MVERIANALTGIATACSGAYSVFSGWDANTVGMVIGLLLTLVFGALNIWITLHYKKKQYDLERDRNEIERQKLQLQIEGMKKRDS